MIKVLQWLRQWNLLALFLVERFQICERYPVIIKKIHPHMVTLFGTNKSMHYTKRFVSRAVAIFLSCMLLTIILIFLANDLSIVGISALVTLLSPYLLLQDLEKKIKQRRQQIILDLPLFVNQLLLLVNAGETVQQALTTCSDDSDLKNSVLYQELKQVSNEIKNNGSFPVIMENFNKRCGVQEVARLTTTIVINFRRGGDVFELALRELTRDLWESRKMLAKRLGEEASSKLIFPMLIIFVVILVIVTAPAILLMNQS